MLKAYEILDLEADDVAIGRRGQRRGRRGREGTDAVRLASGNGRLWNFLSLASGHNGGGDGNDEGRGA